MRSWEPTHTEADVRDAIGGARSLRDALRRLGLRDVGSNRRTLQKLITHYGVSTQHFDPGWARRHRAPNPARPMDEILVEGSTYSRNHLKNRLFAEGLKQRICELCGQGETWRERRMALILDHINGVGDDNRIENLQIVCPNCAATLDTHCGRKNHIYRTPRTCLHCGVEFLPNSARQRYCSLMCGSHQGCSTGPRPEFRKVERPPYEQLMAEIAASNWSAVARTYGVSDNAVRKWVRWYEADAQRRSAGGGE